MATASRLAGNLRLLAESAWQHLQDDPALLAVQISRRLPPGVRVRAGRALHAAAGGTRRGEGLAALGALMTGRSDLAGQSASRAAATSARLGYEVAILLDRTDLVDAAAPPATRARANWHEGDLQGALGILEREGEGEGTQARRLRSELELLQPGFRLDPPRASSRSLTTPEGDRDPEGELRVLHLLTNSLPHTQSGYSLRSHRILGSLRSLGVRSVALTRTGYPVMVGRAGARQYDVVDGVTYRRSLPRSLGATSQARLQQEADAAMDVVASFRPDVIHATTDYRNALVAQAVSEATGIPWVFEVRGLMEQTWIASHSTAENRRRAAESEKAQLVAAREAELARQADQVVTLSRTMADELARRGVDPEGILLMPNGITEDLLHHDSDTATARRDVGLSLPGGAFVVGSVSALVDYEGFDTLLRAVARILEDETAPEALRSTLHVVIAGDGAAAPALRALARELRIGGRVLFPGRVPASAAPDWVQALDAVVVPRRDLTVTQWVTPQKPVEALALARPLILSDLPALREVARTDGGDVCALLVPPESPPQLAEAITTLWRDPGATGRRVAEGRALAARRTWGAQVRRYEAAYRRLVPDPRGADDAR
ncbi:glycosyl transferase family 1 [Brachybacterium endophyticum]|uniref:Glycosyl transferase family 1 n=1 Tax=Brachybacterium endophyticum TaxID=2182385 RepID=A0A2U2RKP7_9MICO|nr:glycosyltransferase [Brachybacterium endophyticum]PWH06448.1 glycosyl transferase family 1 [Brachybacterium endophyticum]